MGAWFPGRAGTTARLSATAREGTIDVAIAPDAPPRSRSPGPGAAGLFAVDVLADGELRGSSTDRDRLQGHVEQVRPAAGSTARA